MTKLKTHVIDPDKCTACTICMTACPVTANTRHFRGPKMTGPALTRMRKFVTDDDPMLDYCSNCKSCDLACPSGVPISTLNMLAKNEYYKTHGRKSLADYILSHSEILGKLVTTIPMASFCTNLGMGIAKAGGMLGIIGVAGDAPMPSYASKSFGDMYKKYKQPSFERKVVFFAGCFIQYNQPEVGMDLIKVYNQNGIEVIFDNEFVCCGAPMMSNGYLKDMTKNAQKNMDRFRYWMDKGYPVITACTSCGLMIKQEYKELFVEAEEMNYAAMMYDSMEYLQLLDDEGQLDTNFQEIGYTYMYHAPCHLKLQGFGYPSVDILRQIPGIRVEEADAGCCGISGSYGFKKDKRAISTGVGSKLFDRIKESHAVNSVTECGTCRLQMEGGTGVKSIHPLTLLRKAYGLR